LVAIYAAREALERKIIRNRQTGFTRNFVPILNLKKHRIKPKLLKIIHLDMDESKPMDRLICGDAGFGKTEVAIRSAFRAVMDGKQVAVLVPTTISSGTNIIRLFCRRFRDFPVRCGSIESLLKSVTEQRKLWKS